MESLGYIFCSTKRWKIQYVYCSENLRVCFSELNADDEEGKGLRPVNRYLEQLKLYAAEKISMDHLQTIQS